MNKKAFIIEDHPGQMAHFMVLFHMGTIMMAYTTLIITANHLETILFGQARGTIYKGSILSSVMIEQTIMYNIFHNDRLSTIISKCIKGLINKINMNRTQNEIVHAIFSYSL